MVSPILEEFAKGMDQSTHPNIWPLNEDPLVSEAFDKGIQDIIIGEKTPQQVAQDVQNGQRPSDGQEGTIKMNQKVKAAAIFKDNLQNFFFVLPAFAIFCIFYIYPFYKMINLSFYDWRGIGPMHFIGLQNYKELMGDNLWWDSMGHAGYITLIALTFQNAWLLPWPWPVTGKSA